MLFLHEIPHLLVDFHSQDIQISQTVWVDEMYFSRPDTFKEKHSYSLKDIVFELSGNHQLKFKAERYATGSLSHAGGARVGNIGNLQIKGIGQNPLTNLMAPVWYSYGGMSLVDGILDCVISKILQKMNPCLCTSTFGILATHNQGGLYCDKITKEKLANYKIEDYQKVWGGLLLRDIQLRPAHLLYSQGFSKLSARRSNIVSENIRIRDTWLHIVSRFRSPSCFLSWLYDFSEKAIANLAFAHAHGIFHGGMTPSNISIEGKWIDLNQVKYSSAQDSSSIDAMGELRVVLKIIKNFIHLYKKFSSERVDDVIYVDHFYKMYHSETERINIQNAILDNSRMQTVKSESDDAKIQSGLRRLIKLNNESKEKIDIKSLVARLKRLMLAQSLTLGLIREHLCEFQFSNNVMSLENATLDYMDYIDWTFDLSDGLINIYKGNDSGAIVRYSLASNCYLLYLDGVEVGRHARLDEALGGLTSVTRIKNVFSKIVLNHFLKLESSSLRLSL